MSKTTEKDNKREGGLPAATVLLACPFCGDNNADTLTQIRSEPLDITVYVMCNTCGSMGAETYIEFNQMINLHPGVVVSRINAAAEAARADWNYRKDAT